MSFCPFLSQSSTIDSGFEKLYPCIQSCELYTNKGCSLKVLAIAQNKLSNITNQENDKS